MIEIILITVLSISLFISFFVIWNLLRKLERMEDYINSLYYTVVSISKRLKEVDNSGMFESDDEIGWFFEEIKKLGDQLDQYRLR